MPRPDPPQPIDINSLQVANQILAIGLRSDPDRDLDGLLAEISSCILDNTTLPYVGIGLLASTRDEVVHFMGERRDGDAIPTGITNPIEVGVVGHVIRTGQTVLLDDVTEFEAYLDLVPGSRSALTVPLKLGDETIGAINSESPDLAHFGPEDLALLEVLAMPVALSIETVQRDQEMRRKMGQLRLLKRVSDAITSTVDLDELLQRTVDLIRDERGWSMVALGLVNEAAQAIVLRAVSTDLDLLLPIGYSEGIGIGVVGEAYRRSASLLVRDVDTFEGYVSAHPDIRCELCSPLKLDDHVLGFIDIASTEPDAFDLEDLELLETLASHIYQAISNARNLRRITRLREDLSKMVVHDLRNPMTVIGSLVDLHAKDLADPGGADSWSAASPGDQELFIQSASSAYSQMRTLLDSLLTLQKLEANALPIHKQPCDPAALVRESGQRMVAVATARNVTLEWSDTPDLDAVCVDPRLLVRVLDNLVLNALNATPAGGHVSLVAEPAEPEQVAQRLPMARAALRLAVLDTGPGVPPEDRERIFEKFASGTSRHRSQRRSVGLGLAFCRLAIRAHGGAIWVNDREGPGSRFVMLLPQ